MKTNLLTIACIVSVLVAGRQTSIASSASSLSSNNTRSSYIGQSSLSMAAVDILPAFPGGAAGLMNYLDQNLSYTRSARTSGLSGKAFVSFVVNENGAIENVHLLSGLESSIDAQLSDAISRMPSWTPGMSGGHPVKTNYVLPVSFILK